MNKILPMVGLLLLGTISFAQKFSVGELIKLYNADNDFFDSYVLQKGYNFADAKKDDLRYNYNDKSAFNSISVEYSNSKIDTTTLQRNIFWIFVSAETYLSFKKELSDLGFAMYYDTSTQKGDDSYHHFLYANRNPDPKKIF